MMPRRFYVLVALLLPGVSATAPSTPLYDGEDLRAPTVLFAHGLTGYGRELLHFTRGTEYTGEKTAYYLFDVKQHNLKMFDFDDAIPHPTPLQVWKIFRMTSLAQAADVAKLRRHFDATRAPHKIGFGVSRGASTWLAMLGSHPATPKLDALVLEAPFATIRETAGYHLAQKIVRQLAPEAARYHGAMADRLISSVLARYNILHPQPLDLLPGINRAIPILIVQSHDDDVVPYRNAWLLCQAFQRLGFSDVYYLEVPHGVHGNILWSRCSGLTYRNVVHAFFKKYHLPHNPEYAAQAVIDRYRL